MPENNGWGEWENYVLNALEDNKADHKEIMAELKAIGKDVARLQVKAGLWGFVAGAIPVIVAFLMKQF